MNDPQRVYVNIISEAKCDAKHFWPCVGKIGKYIFEQSRPQNLFCINVHSLLPASVFWCKTERESSFLFLFILWMNPALGLCPFLLCFLIQFLSDFGVTDTRGERL